jgi:hypothetical protein
MRAQSDAAGLEVGEYETRQSCSTEARPLTGEDLLLLVGELDPEQRIGRPGGHRDRLEVAPDAAEDAAPGPRAPDAVEDQALGGHVEGDHVVLAGLGHHELVLARLPGEDVEQDLPHVVLDRVDQVLGLEAPARRGSSDAGPGR